jgi:hypothetical protein
VEKVKTQKEIISYLHSAIAQCQQQPFSCSVDKDTINRANTYQVCIKKKLESHSNNKHIKTDNNHTRYTIEKVYA